MTKPEKTQRPLFHEEFAEKIIAHLKAGTAPWQKPWEPRTSNGAPHNPASGTVYRGINRVNLALSGYDDPRWMTLKQANDKGLRIQAGSKATTVVFYQWTRETDRKDDDGKPIVGEDGKPEKVTVQMERPLMRFAHVFNGEQIEGMPPFEPKDRAYEWEPEEKAENILRVSGANINHDQDDRAFYRYASDSIHLPPKAHFPTPGGYYDTALHELGHWTRHFTRLDRENGPFGSPMYAREELRAEISSWMMGQDLGIPHNPESHASYVQSWVQALEDDPLEIMRACRDAEQIKEYIMGLERQVELAKETPAVAQEVEEQALPQRLAQEKIFLSVPYVERNAAKKFGARWDADEKLWFAPAGTDLSPLENWLPKKEVTPERVMSPQEEFAAAIHAMGIDLQGKMPEMDGKIHRVPLLDDGPGGRNGAYCGYLNGRPAGWMENFSAGAREKWVSSGHIMTPEQKAVLAQEQFIRAQEREQERREGQEKAAIQSGLLWSEGHDALSEHPYLVRKGIPALDIRESPSGNTLLVPLRNSNGELRGLQQINLDGEKRFVAGIEKKGCFHVIGGAEGKMPDTAEILLSEGYATGASLHLATQKPVAVAFDAGNLEPVAKALREKFPKAKITICADNDHAKQRNIGVEKAELAAQAVGGTVKVPTFSEEEKAKGYNDFNDLYQSRGLKEVARQVGVSRQKAVSKEREL